MPGPVRAEERSDEDLFAYYRNVENGTSHLFRVNRSEIGLNSEQAQFLNKWPLLATAKEKSFQEERLARKVDFWNGVSWFFEHEDGRKDLIELRPHEMFDLLSPLAVDGFVGDIAMNTLGPVEHQLIMFFYGSDKLIIPAPTPAMIAKVQNLIRVHHPLVYEDSLMKVGHD